MLKGTLGAGKTTTGRALQQLLPGCVFLDGDRCWDMRPFVVDAKTKKMVEQNIDYRLNIFLHGSVCQNVFFCWAMHEQAILDSLPAALNPADQRVYRVKP
ncbi:MAG: AAA family ATPase [Negativicutes bacterium]|nr:AAA family ATPase [Negativicutes bacterium]